MLELNILSFTWVGAGHSPSLPWVELARWLIENLPLLCATGLAGVMLAVSIEAARRGAIECIAAMQRRFRHGSRPATAA